MAKVEKTMANMAKCQCMKCPSYAFACMTTSLPVNFKALVMDVSKKDRLEGMFCAFQKSIYITVDKGCLCDACALHNDCCLDKTFFCLATGGK